MKTLFVLNNDHQHEPVDVLGSNWIGTPEAEALRSRAHLALAYWMQATSPDVGLTDEAMHDLMNCTVLVYAPIVGEAYAHDLARPGCEDVLFALRYGPGLIGTWEVGYVREYTTELIVELV